jgi:hypothetical protein
VTVLGAKLDKVRWLRSDAWSEHVKTRGSLNHIAARAASGVRAADSRR